MQQQPIIRFAIPDGSLKEQSLRLLDLAGIRVKETQPRQLINVGYNALIDIRFVRPATAALLLRRGEIDCAIVGSDWLRETKDTPLSCPITEQPLSITKTGRGSSFWKLAVPSDSNISSMRDLLAQAAISKRETRIATELPNTVSTFFDDVFGKFARRLFTIEKPSEGASAALVGWGYDAVVDVVETGATLEANGLRPIANLFNATGVLALNMMRLNDVGRNAENPERGAVLREIQSRFQAALVKANAESGLRGGELSALG